MKHDWTVEDHDEYRNAIVRESQRRRRALARTKGMCSVCCIRPAMPGMVTCQQCSMSTGYANKKRSMRNKENGLCPVCGKNPPAKNRKRCYDCILKANEYSRKYKKKPR